MTRINNINELKEGDILRINKLPDVTPLPGYVYARAWRVVVVYEHVVGLRGISLSDYAVDTQFGYILTNDKLNHAEVIKY